MGRICEVQISGAGRVVIWVNSREHCEPHVHSRDIAKTWEGRIQFSFMSSYLGFLDCFGKHPGTGVFSEIMKEMSGRLADFRREWWRCNANGIGCCLVNTMQDDAVGRPRRVAAAMYDSATNSIELTFANQFVRVVQLS
jgi:hypothetical protein